MNPVGRSRQRLSARKCILVNTVLLPIYSTRLMLLVYHILYQIMNDKPLFIDIYCLVHWYKDTVTVVWMSSIVDGASVGDQCNVKSEKKFIQMPRYWLLVNYKS